MDDASTPRPGEVRPPAARRLDRPPSERYPTPPPAPGLITPRLDLALLAGFGGVIAGALSWLVTGGVFDLGGGLLVVAVAVGWLVGGATAFGAWHGRPHRGAGRIPLLAAGLGVPTWCVGTVLLYLYAEITLPGSALTLAERLASTPFLDWLAPQFTPLGPLEILLMAGVSWWSAR
ncbi:MAG: hypothetical protein ACHQZR_06860 [Candidatus Limnocylindrales bacterium]